MNRGGRQAWKLFAIPTLVVLLLGIVPTGTSGGVQLPVRLVVVEDGFSLPLFVGHAGDGSNRLFVVEQAGLIKVLNGGVLDPVPYLDIDAKVACCGERGLLGLAFHPDFETNGRLFVAYTRTADGALTLERYTVANPLTDKPSPSAGVVLLTIAHPRGNHNGGMLAFGPDGFLYWSTGDGGGAGDPDNNGQNKNTLLGKILRLNVDVAGTYAIPADNPFAQGGGRGEIWSYGLRNPWRFSFDRATGDLWIADVGQNVIEEVNIQPAGAAGGRNYGWPVWEGHNLHRPAQVTTVDPLTLTFPIHEYAHNAECSITGGYVYRGPNAPLLTGSYVFGDFCSGLIRSMRMVGPAFVAVPVAAAPLFSISSFGEDEVGNVYVCDLEFGVVRRIESD